MFSRFSRIVGQRSLTVIFIKRGLTYDEYVCKHALKAVILQLIGHILLIKQIANRCASTVDIWIG
jgi:hypothetical protein